jgi:GLPGLI family protein
MKKNIVLSCLCGIIIVLLSACGANNSDKISEGVIEYDAMVVDQSNPMASMAPNKMIFHFKENKACAEMSAGMGLFATSFISDPETRSLTQLLKLMTKKFSLKQNAAEIKAELAQLPVEIKKLKETKMIAGYKCRKAHVKMLDDSGSEFDIYYSNDFSIKDPNFCTPFHEIDGVLMEYQMKKFNLEMKFTAKTVKREEVEEAVFEIPADYKAISQKEMKELFDGLQ